MIDRGISEISIALNMSLASKCLLTAFRSHQLNIGDEPEPDEPLPIITLSNLCCVEMNDTTTTITTTTTTIEKLYNYDTSAGSII